VILPLCSDPKSRKVNSPPTIREIGCTYHKSEPCTRGEPRESAEILLSRLAKGNEQALGILFQQYSGAVRTIGGRILRSADEAEDFVQELFLFIRVKCSSFDSAKSTAGSWIIQMAYRRAIDRRRRLIARHFYAREDLYGAASQLVGKATTEDDYSPEAVFGRNGLEKVIGELSEDQRETLRLYFFEGYTLAEISAKMGQSLGNVRNHYYRGLNTLRKHMLGRKLRPVGR
jgi:RNA polymerase sigma-70 factor, ECF subfamily